MLNTSHSIPRIGQIVRITHGRETDQHMIVIKHINDRYVLLADGEKRKYDQPKRKNINHFEAIDYISEEIEESLLDNGRVTNGKIRFAINKFAGEIVTDDMKGDELDDEGRSN